MINLTFTDDQKTALGNIVNRHYNDVGAMRIEWVPNESQFTVKFYKDGVMGYVAYIVNDAGGIVQRFTGGLD